MSQPGVIPSTRPPWMSKVYTPASRGKVTLPKDTSHHKDWGFPPTPGTPLTPSTSPTGSRTRSHTTLRRIPSTSSPLTGPGEFRGEGRGCPGPVGTETRHGTSGPPGGPSPTVHPSGSSPDSGPCSRSHEPPHVRHHYRPLFRHRVDCVSRSLVTPTLPRSRLQPTTPGPHHLHPTDPTVLVSHYRGHPHSVTEDTPISSPCPSSLGVDDSRGSVTGRDPESKGYTCHWMN